MSDEEKVVPSEPSEPSEQPLGAVDSAWGKLPDDHFGYASEEERIEKRGLEDWELAEQVQHSSKRVPRWFIAVIVAVVIVAFTLTEPFWGDRPGHHRPWFDWGDVIAVVYFLVAAVFINFMVNNFAPAEEEGEEEEDEESPSDPSRGEH
ncbi:MAG: hypothetical protein Q9M26_01635 [Mariprofundales bacterium]|nr:hypothetical protein [Mariprofundales bacterium]